MRFIFIIALRSLVGNIPDELVYETYAEDAYWALDNFEREHPEWMILDWKYA